MRLLDLLTMVHPVVPLPRADGHAAVIVGYGELQQSHQMA
jgi:hypothetical protein